MSSEYYIVASVSGVHIYKTSSVYKTKSGVIEEYKRQIEVTGSKDTIRILKANWVDADFDQYIQLKNLNESECDSDE